MRKKKKNYDNQDVIPQDLSSYLSNYKKIKET